MAPHHSRQIIATSALPYANSSLHLGHLLEVFQTDAWVRFQKMRGHQCFYIGGSDSHGTPIMIQAEKLGISPEQLVRQISAEHQQDCADFCIEFSNFYTTHSAENQQLVESIYQAHLAQGNIHKRTIKQAFDPEKKMFLSDRLIKGECPKCGAQNQYGDNCEACGATYSPTELRHSYSTLSGAKPIQKSSEHYFFKLQHFETMLHEWTRQGHLQASVTHKLDEWFNAGLEEWDISRDAPYFGFKIPGESEKYFYCWLDAPVGYLASFKNYCDKTPGMDFAHFWKKDSTTELYHFIGKDIMYFHALFWPAILSGAGYRTPTQIKTHGFLTINGQKMSKSRGTFIKARTYLDHLHPDYLRYYFAAKLNEHIEDIDIQFDDFIQRINADLIGKYVNIASRCANFINHSFSGQLSTTLAEPALYNEFANAGNEIAEKFDQLAYSQAVRHIMALADRANQYIDEKKPWAMIKDASRSNEVHDVCSMGIQLFRLLTLYLKPILPKTTEAAEQFLNSAPLMWEAKDKPLLGHRINAFHPLLQRIDKKQVDAMIDQEKQTAAETRLEIKKSYVSIDDFAKIDLRVAKIIQANHVKGADKLLQLQLDLGDESRQVFAGIKSAYSPETLIGKLVVVVANLEPRTMRFGVSEGMVLAAGPGGEAIWLLSPDSGATPGMKIK